MSQEVAFGRIVGDAMAHKWDKIVVCLLKGHRPKNYLRVEMVGEWELPQFESPFYWLKRVAVCLRCGAECEPAAPRDGPHT